jgi:archaellum component FlaG (FlaF/FlaG flagellin family)
MGFSTTYTELIILMASIILATSASTYILYMGSSMQSSIMQLTQEANRALNTRIEIVYATIMNGSQTGYKIYVKNVGSTTITSYRDIDVYIGPYGQASYYKYNSTPTQNAFTITDADGDGAWEPWETAEITVYTQPATQGVIEVRVKPPQGPTATYLFTPP